MMRLSILCGALALSISCGGTPGTLGSGRVAAARAVPGVAGLTKTEEARLRQGPGTLTLVGVNELIPADASFFASLDLLPLVSSGLADALLAQLPPEKRATYDRVCAETGVDVGAMDGFVLWLDSGRWEQGDADMRMAIVAPRSTVLQLTAFFDLLNKEMREGSEDTTPNEAEEVTGYIGAPLPAAELEETLGRSTKGLTEVERLSLDDRTVLLHGVDDDGRLNWYYVWPNGMLGGTLHAPSGPPMHATAAAAVESVVRVEAAHSSAASTPSTVPTLSFEGELDGKLHRLEASVDSRVEIIYESVLDTFGGAERVEQMLSNWDAVREVMLKGLSSGNAFGGKEEVRELAIQLLQNAELTETSEGLRIETDVDTDVLSGALHELKD